jgi:hypothetical protein
MANIIIIILLGEANKPVASVELADAGFRVIAEGGPWRQKAQAAVDTLIGKEIKTREEFFDQKTNTSFLGLRTVNPGDPMYLTGVLRELEAQGMKGAIISSLLRDIVFKLASDAFSSGERRVILGELAALDANDAKEVFGALEKVSRSGG